MTRSNAARSAVPRSGNTAERDEPSRTRRTRGVVGAAVFESSFDRFVCSTREHDAMLLRIELSGFRGVEERWGIERSDALREELIQRTLRAAGPAALMGRLGTDELTLLLPFLPEGLGLEEQLAVVRAALDVRDEDGSGVVAHVGGVRFDGQMRDPAELRMRARKALQHASGSRTGRTALYDTDLHAQLDARARLLEDIRRGAIAGEFTLHYQPICNVEGQARGFEALMRWQHRERGLLAPFHFLAAFDHPALSILLGDVAIRTAVAQMRTWRDAGLDFGYIAVNLATEQFAAGDLAESVRAVLEEYDVAPSSLMLEVTETVYLDRDAERIVATLNSLRDLGVRVALDDFGTGYASLSHLKTLPVDRLKIDRAFVKGVKQQTVEAAIVGAMVLLGKSLGVEVVAEGVETEAELAVLRDLGCERIQGFLFSKPLAPSDAGAFMARLDPPRQVSSSPERRSAVAEDLLAVGVEAEHVAVLRHLRGHAEL